MKPKCIILTHGGQWNDNTYVGGQRELVRVLPDGMTYVELLRKVGCAVQADINVHTYVIDAIVPAPSPLDELLRMKITDDDDLEYVMELFDVPTLYVTLSARINASKEQSSVNLLNAQMHQVQQTYVHRTSNIPHLRPFVGNDATINHVNGNVMNEREDVRDIESGDGVQTDCGGDQDVSDEDRRDNDDEANNRSVDGCSRRDRHNMPPIGSSSCNEEEHEQGRHWVPGAKYQASLPRTELGLPYDNNRETISIGATFTDKENMRIQLGLYHLMRRKEYIVDRSTKRRFGALCKFKDQCSFVLRATTHGTEIWRIFKLVAHTCQMDLRCRGRPTVCAKVIGAYFAPSLLKEGTVLKPKQMQAQLQRDFGVDVDYATALAGRKQAMTMIYGEKDKSFLSPKKRKDKSFRSSFQSSSSSHVRGCSRCHKSGHNRARCTEDIPFTQDEDVGSNQLTATRKRRPKRCGICGELGHTRGKCTQRVV